MNPLRSYPPIALIVALLSILGLSLAHQSVEMLVVAGTLAALSWLVTEGPRGLALPRWLSNILVLAACAVSVFEAMQNRTAVGTFEVVGRFCLYLMLIKLYERKKPRDHSSLLLLGMVMMITGTLLTADLLFGVVMLAYAVLAIYALLLFHLYAGFEQYRMQRAQTLGLSGPAVGLRPITGRGVSGQFRTLTVTVGMVGVVVSVLIFLLFPRNLGAGMVSALNAPRVEREVGFSSDIDLIVGDRINNSRRVIGYLQAFDEDAKPRRLDTPILLRGSVLERYIGPGKWAEHEPARHDVRSLDYDPFLWRSVLGQRLPTPNAYKCELQFRSPVPRIFSPWLPVNLRIETPRRVYFDRATHLFHFDDGDRRFTRYSVIVDPDPGSQILSNVSSGDSVWRSKDEGYPGPRTRRGVAPKRVTRFASLGQSILREAGIPASAPAGVQYAWNVAAAEAFADYLNRDPFYYTLDTSDVAFEIGNDPIEQFVFETRRGHCEFFASALAAMCQCMGIEARIVTGYAVSDFNEETQRYRIREGDAHAWVEVRSSNDAYTTIDPTPSGAINLAASDDAGIAERIGWLYQDLEGRWGRGVVDYDQNAQSRIAGRLDTGWSEKVSQYAERLRDWAQSVNRAFYFGPAGYVWMGIVAFAIAIAVVALIKLMKRSRRVRAVARLENIHGRDYQRMLRGLGFYVDMLDVLARSGRPKPDWQPPLAFARKALADEPETARIVRDITDLFYRARYGRDALSSDALGEARRAVRTLASHLGVRL
jgi:transglutaminase-like putative cysteine protease